MKLLSFFLLFFVIGAALAIYGGQKVNRGKWTWTVAIYRVRHVGDPQFFCSGSLISQRHVLSAANCFHSKGQSKTMSATDIFAALGKHDLSDDFETGSKKSNVSEIIIHPDWDAKSIRYDADIAILVLVYNVVFGGNIQRISLPQQSYNKTVGTGTIVGWGKTEDSDSTGEFEPKKPKKLIVPVIESVHCYLTFTEIAMISSNRTFCGGYLNQSKGPCSGDSGAGFYKKNAMGSWAVEGIVSASRYDVERGCDVDIYSLYTNVAAFADWIKKVID